MTAAETEQWQRQQGGRDGFERDTKNKTEVGEEKGSFLVPFSLPSDPHADADAAVSAP